MRLSVGVAGLLVLALIPSSVGLEREADSPVADAVLLMYRPEPMAWTVATLPAGIDVATVTDVVAVDLDGDHQCDLAVAWYATDLQNRLNNERGLTILFGAGTTLTVGPTFDLFVPHPAVAALDVFRNGTSEVAAGDFDGDGDADLAVLAYFGDEAWFIENLGERDFATYLRYPFGYNSTGNFITPPEAAAADFDHDGRDELVYIVDPVLRYNQRIIHFWEASGAVAGMHRVYWEGEEQLFTQFTRGLTVADFDGDSVPDLCFTGCTDPGPENDPILTFWCGLDTRERTFAVHHEYPAGLCADVVAVQPDADCRPGVLLTDLDGLAVDYWAGACTGEVDFWATETEDGFAGCPDRGMAGVVADVDGDGDPDLVTKQRHATEVEARQIEFALCSDGGQTWTRTGSDIDTTGFRADAPDDILRPQNLAVADLFGNALPEVIAGFAADDAMQSLRIVVWRNGCAGDVTRDGITTYADLQAARLAEGFCAGQPLFDADADLNKSGCVEVSDMWLVVDDLNCGCGACEGQLLGDCNCDGAVDDADLSALLLAFTAGRTAWEAKYGGNGCDFLCVNDIDHDGRVSSFDISPFVRILSLHSRPGSGGALNCPASGNRM
ncbi:MAG: FG-GAP-like repeat-containing protein [Phycisphaerae bacterium]|jgi:hypothetical protein